MLSVAFGYTGIKLKTSNRREYERLRNMQKLTFPSKLKPRVITRQLRKH